MQVMYVSAEPGQPSTFWQGESGKWYRTKRLAQLDNQSNAVNPNDFEVKTTWWKRNNKAVKISAIVSVIVVIAAIIIYKKK